MRRILAAALCLTTLAIPRNTNAAEYFNFNAQEAVERIRSIFDAKNFVVPIQDLKCGKPGVLRYCNANITQKLTISLAETSEGDDNTPEPQRLANISKFLAGSPGKIYSLLATLGDIKSRNDFEVESFDKLCSSFVAITRNSVPIDRAYRIYEKVATKVFNRPSKDLSEQTLSDRKSRSTLIVRVTSGTDLECEVTADESYFE